MPLPLNAEGPVYLRLTPDRVSPTRNVRAPRRGNRPQDDASELEGAGAWILHDADDNFNAPPRNRRISLSPSPTQKRPSLYLDTREANALNESNLPLASGPRRDSAYRSSASRQSNDCDDSLLSDGDAGEEETQDEDVFFSAQSSQVWDNSPVGSPRHTWHDQWTAADVQPTPHSGRTSPVGLPGRLSKERHHRDLSYLGIPGASSLISSDTGRRGMPREPSVISDGGEQQQLRQEQRRARKQGPPPVPSSPLNERSIRFSHAEQYGLQKQIYDELQRTAVALNPSTPAFLPKGQLKVVVNPDSVRVELRKKLENNYKDSKILHHVKDVCVPQEVGLGEDKKLKSFRKIFAILILLDMSASILHFIKENVSDLDLPLVPVREKQTIVGFRRRDASAHEPAHLLQCFDGNKWSYSKFIEFENKQWMLLAPFFSNGENGEVKHYILQDNHVLPFLPFTGCDDVAEHYGGFARVLMVDIHPDHHNFNDMIHCKRGFAIKQLYKEDREAFDRERFILKRFSGHQSHRHIISLLATYEQHNKFHLIFYRAEGDLFKLWKESVRQPDFNCSNVCWMAEQCAGIADALMHLHRHLTFIHHEKVEEDTKKANSESQFGHEHFQHFVFGRSETMQSSGARVPLDSPTWIPGQDDLKILDHTDAEIIVSRFGRHGDLDPGNILWYSGGSPGQFSPQATLKIADFGQATLNSLQSKTTQSPVANKETYRPPEYDIMPRTIRQSYDIWCLGCVFLEFATWMLGGADLLQKFVVARIARDGIRNDVTTDRFFELTNIRDSEMIEAIVKPAVTKFIDDLHRHEKCTNFIHDLLNLVQERMVVVDSTERERCDQVKKCLDEMYENCRKDRDYACKRNPWLNGNSQTSEGFPYSTRWLPPRQVDDRQLFAQPNHRQLERRHSGLNVHESSHHPP